ncbi:MAG TPA: tetratricopeptide repeat protein [Polyangia bacterium]|jgi:tetratricopeptide (TPR) repeat protein|nr:tetratricopeptide repeat protein [Polyangia bacterium]
MHDVTARGIERAAFAGREEEREALDSALERALQFKAPQLVTVVGALGIGKTRLVGKWLSNQRGTALRVVQAASPGDGVADREEYGLLAALLRARFGLTPELDADQALALFRGELQQVFGDRRVAEVAALLGGFLGFEMPESPLSRALAHKPEQGTELARAVLCRFFEQDAAATPLVIVCEDLQNADDASLDVLGSLAAELGESPIVIIATARPDILVRRPGWGHLDGNHTRLELGPLRRRDIETMIRSMLDEPHLADGLLDRVASESGGNPFLLEQLLRVYQQHGILVADVGTGWTFDADRAARESMAITPEEAAHARLGTLSAAERDVLARGATFGAVFWTGGVVALGRFAVEITDGFDGGGVFGPDPAVAEIRQILTQLAQRDYLVAMASSSLPGESEWGFKHVLDQNLVEGSVSPEVMRRRKAFAAQWLESRAVRGRDAGTQAEDRATRESRLETLGHLYEQAGDSRRAAYCFITAANRARDHLQLDRARVLYVAGIGLLGVDDAIVQMDALFSVGDAAARLGRTREAVGHFQKMLHLAWRLDLPAKGGAAHDRIGRLLGMLGDHRRALAHLEQARQLFHGAGDLPGIASALDDIGRIHFLAGSPEASLNCHRAALSVRERLKDDRGRSLALARMGQVEHETGDLAAAMGHFQQALALRRHVGDRQGVVCSLLDLGGLERDLGHLDRALEVLEEGRTLAREIGERLFECSLGIEIGDCHLAEGQPRRALEEFMAAKQIARQFGAKLLFSEAARGVAESELTLGDPQRALDEARAAFQIADKIGSPPLAGAALRVAAAAVGLGAPGEAELGGAREMFDRAVEVLSNAGAELELGRALTAYADFEERNGRRDAADELRRQADLIRDRARRPLRTRALPTESIALH